MSANVLHGVETSESRINVTNPPNNIAQSSHHYFDKMDVPGKDSDSKPKPTHHTPIIDKLTKFGQKKLSHDLNKNITTFKDINKLNLEEAMNLANKIADDFSHSKKSAHKNKVVRQRYKNQIYTM